MSADHPVIGILGGMGPEATIELMKRVVAATPARDDVDHIHMIVDNNPKVPSRIKALIERTGPDPGPELIRMARGLEASGASALAIACNTAHVYADRIRREISIPLIDMIAATADAVAAAAPKDAVVGLLASPAVVDLHLYHRELGARGFTTLAATPPTALLDIIKAVKRGDTGDTIRAAFRQVARETRESGAALLVIGCTELSVISTALDTSPPPIDALDALARRIVEFALRQGVPV